MINKSTLEFVKSLSLADKKTLTGKSLKATEEVGELAKEILPYDGNSGTLHRFPTKNKILEECADVILAALSIAYSLDYDDEAIDNMILQKSKKWDGLQKNEQNFNSELIPFEIHITVNDPNGLSDGFKYYCESNNIKAIFIENYNENGQYIDVMTSTKHIGTNKSVLAEVDRISKILEDGGWYIIRKKIETPVWHPIAKFHPYPV